MSLFLFPFRSSYSFLAQFLITSTFLHVTTISNGVSSPFDSEKNILINAGPSNDVLSRARSLKPPKPQSSFDAEFESWNFWEENGLLIRQAWSALEANIAGGENNLSSLRLEPFETKDDEREGLASGSMSFDEVRIFDLNLTHSVSTAWSHPGNETEGAVRSLFEEVAPAVYKCQLFSVEGVEKIRSYLDMATSSGIPTRRPNGMNRYGIIIDEKIDGAVSLSGLSSFNRALVSNYVRPIGRMLFPNYVGGPNDDCDSFSFTIRYRQGEDLKLDGHTDASVYTMNVNLNLPREGYSGSKVSFFVGGASFSGEERYEVDFEPGMAIFHRGAVHHAASSIEGDKGSVRQNLVVWLFGKDGYVRVAPYNQEEQMDVKARWTKCFESGEQKERVEDSLITPCREEL